MQISKIDDKLSIYRENSVFLVGIGEETEILVNLIKYFNIEVEAIFTNNAKKNERYNGIRVLPVKFLPQMVGNYQSVVIQVADKMLENNIQEELRRKNILIKAQISYNEALDMLNMFRKLENIKKSQPYYSEDIVRISSYYSKKIYFAVIEGLCNIRNDEAIMLLSPFKNCDLDLLEAFAKKEKEIELINMKSIPAAFDKVFVSKYEKPVKIIVGVNDPIDQNIFSSCTLLTTEKFDYEWETTIFDEDALKNGGDIDTLLEIFDKHYNTSEFNMSREAYGTYGISAFMKSFNENVIDLMQYPFDKDKGYSIIKEGNLEIFVFQGEKIENASKELSVWAGNINFENLNKKSNNPHWLELVYSNALKEIKFSREYFDRMYSDPYISHFYNDEDIAKFKARWEKHIK